MTTTTTHDAPRFALGQQVRVIANNGGLYAAQIGVVGVIERISRKPAGRYYHVGYPKPFSLPNEQGRHKVVIVREDDLEPVAGDTPRFALGEEVIVNAPGWIWDRHVATVRGVDRAGSEQAWLYTVAIAWPNGDSRLYDFWEAQLQRDTDASGAAKPTKASAEQPKFALGEHVTVDPRSALAYASYTRRGAIGVIVGVGKPVRGIRRYDVRYSGTPEATHAAQRNALGLLPVAQIREEHLVKAEAPTPPAPDSEPPHDDGWGTWDGDALMKAKERADDAAYTTVSEDEPPASEPPHRPARHAHAYRDDHPRGEHLWCDAGGCFIEDCAICRAYLGDTLTSSPAQSPTVTEYVERSDGELVKHEQQVLFACARGGGRATCAHEWQTWGADSRYRLCRKCKAAERVVSATGSEVATP